MRRLISIAALLLWVPTSFASQPDAKSLLREAAARYRDATNFRIEFETTINSSAPFSSGWSKQTYILAASDRKFHWEADGSGAHRIRISDGQSDWFYRPGVNKYSIRFADSPNPRIAANGTAGGTTAGWIQAAMHSLLHLDDDADAATLERDEVLRIGKMKIPCYVVRASYSMSFHEGTNSTREHSYWIDKATGVVRKAVQITTGPLSAEDDENDKERTVATVYARVDLGTVPDPSLFEFKPPAGAYLVDDARQTIAPPLAIGSAAPALKLAAQNSDVFDLGQLKGKVVLVDFWASWCGACLPKMKELAQLPQSFSDKGLVIVSVDEDETPARGDNYFASQHFPWSNLHDLGEIHRRSWGVTAFPFLVLVDREGRVVWTYSGAGGNFSETLRTQLNKPELQLKP